MYFVLEILKRTWVALYVVKNHIFKVFFIDIIRMDIEAPTEETKNMVLTTTENSNTTKKSTKKMPEAIRALAEKRKAEMELKDFNRQEQKKLEEEVKNEIIARREAEKLRRENEVKELRDEMNKLREFIMTTVKTKEEEQKKEVKRSNKDTFNTMFLRNY